jgi:DNA-binding phage protein
VAVARDYEGVYDLMMMWSEVLDTAERDEIVADIQDMIDECSEPVGPRKERYVRFDDLDWIANNIMKFKDNLRREVDTQGMTLTQLAERTGMPLPSLSRFFNNASMPRRATLLKIAEALDLSAVEIATDWDY